MRARSTATFACLSLALCACDRSLEVTGAIQRLVGETVTLALTEGEPVFSGELWLRAPDATYKPPQLKVTKKDERTISFVVPVDVAIGGATAIVWAGPGVYEVPLQLNRLALTLDDKLALAGWPLAPGGPRPALGPSAAAGSALLAVTPEGSELVVAAGDQLRFVGIGAELKDVAGGIKQDGVKALAALTGGALVATDSSLIHYRFARGGQITQVGAKDFPFTRALAVSENGATAVALSACEPNTDCLSEFALGAGAPAKGREVKLDTTLSAKVVGLTRDGLGAVVGDVDCIYGVWLGVDPPKVTRWDWSIHDPTTQTSVPFKANPTAIDRTPATVNGVAVDLFAVAENEKSLLAFVAFNPSQSLQRTNTAEVTLADKPVCLSYGRRTELVVGGGRALYVLDAGQATPAVRKLDAASASAIASCVVQP
jgi:hypothetical protein